MRAFGIASLIFINLFLFSCKESIKNESFIEQDLTQYVNTLIGTQPWSGKIQLAGPELAEGHTFPGVCTPFGMTEWSPQTTTGTIPYWYEEEGKIQGFRASHYPSGAVMAEYGSFTLFPATGIPEIDPIKRASSFSHATEIAKPHYYTAFLDDSQVKAEITATSRAGFLQFTYPKSDSAYLSFDFIQHNGELQVDTAKNEVYGFSAGKGLGTPQNFACYFVAIFEKDIVDYTLSKDATTGWASFTTEKDELIKVKIGTSFISIEQARLNLNAEIPDWDFDAICEQTKAAWNNELNKIQVEDANEANKTVFYTALYHALLLPREFSEQGKYYSPFDGKIHEGVSYTDFSLWDTYRAEHPLLIFIAPEKVELMIQSLLNNYDEGGWIPKWPNPGYSNVMMGSHADAVIADAYVKGLRNFDVEKAWKAMEKGANETATGIYDGRVGIEDYKHFGFVPGDKHGESVARTLEFAYDDFCLAQMAKYLGKEEAYEKYSKRANYYKNVLDSETNNIRGKNSNGSWMDDQDNGISVWAGNTDKSLEIYKWNHTFLAPHDVDGLITFFGGTEKFVKALDTLFDQEYYYVGDEFSMHAPYLYNYGGKPWKTQKLVRELLADYFTDQPDGLCGNDDCGQLSSWYIFGAMGFYPVAPGEDNYAIGSPLFDKVSMQLQNGKRFIVTSENMSAENIYIQSAQLNGSPFYKSFITHSEIMAGGNLHFVMSDQPNKNWGVGKGNIPVSSIDGYDYLPGPSIKSRSTAFEDSVIVKLESVIDAVQIYYTLDGSAPTNKSTLYNTPLLIKESTTIKVIAYKEGYKPSITLETYFAKKPKGRSVKLLSEYHPKYPGNGPEGLIDYVWGNLFFNSNKWQGYYGNDMVAVVDLGKKQVIKSIAASFLMDGNNWIFFPKEVSYYGSNDGVNFSLIKSLEFDNSPNLGYETATKSFDITTNQSFRYIKVSAKNQSVCPDWHPFGGSECWLFADEISINN